MILSGRTGGRKAWRWGVRSSKRIRDALGIRAIGRTIVSDGEQQQLRDVQQPYNGHFDLEKDRLSKNIGIEWNFFPDN